MNRNIVRKLIGTHILFTCFFASTMSHAAMTRAQAQAIVDAADRTPDAELDMRRKPVDLLLFTGVEPGMKVADIDSGRGWTTELMGRAVGPTGVIYGRTNENRLDALITRLDIPALQHAVPVGRAIADPLPPEANDLDIVIVLFAYHHLILQPDDVRAQAYANVMKALKPGGSFVVVDTQAKDGSGPETGNTIHRLAPDLMRRELEGAGFEFAASGDFLQNPQDTMETNGDTAPGVPSAFVQRYVKPSR